MNTVQLWSYSYLNQSWVIEEYRGRKHSGILIQGTFPSGEVFFKQNHRYEFLGRHSSRGIISESSIQEFAKEQIVKKLAPYIAAKEKQRAERQLSPLVAKTAPQRPAKHINERNDCTVRALSIACQIPYEQAIRIAQAAGRKANRGFQSGTLLLLGRITCGLNYSAYTNEYVRRTRTVEDFVLAHPKGRYIIETNNHAMAVVDGKIIDDLDYTRRHVVAAYEVHARN